MAHVIAMAGKGVPHDDLVYQYDCDGRPTVTLPEDSPVRKALQERLHKRRDSQIGGRI